MKFQPAGRAEVFQRNYGTLQLLAGSDRSGRMATRNADLKIITVQPGKSTSHHFHLERESIFYVTAGELLFVSESAGAQLSLSVGDTLVLEPGEDHCFTNVGPQPAVFLEIESPPHSSTDKNPAGRTPGPLRRALGTFWARPGIRPKLKICGVKSLDAAVACLERGIDAIGLHAVGDRWGNALDFADWTSMLPSSLSIFLLSDRTDPSLIGALLERLNCDTLQLQGRLSIDEIRRVSIPLRELGYKVVKSLAVPEQSELLLQMVKALEDQIDAVLLDSSWRGGTGQEPDWELVETIKAKTTVPVIVAGGISSRNIGNIGRQINPFGMDVESSVETVFEHEGTRRTAKSPLKISELVEALREAFE